MSTVGKHALMLHPKYCLVGGCLHMGRSCKFKTSLGILSVLVTAVGRMGLMVAWFCDAVRSGGTRTLRTPST